VKATALRPVNNIVQSYGEWRALQTRCAFEPIAKVEILGGGARVVLNSQTHWQLRIEDNSRSAAFRNWNIFLAISPVEI